ncbi:hypothetical protein [Gordonia amicalis]|uniref:hypothetical protein n=1 Tax=Gordonia amicalis TaxID=89053 RepID=UPI0024B8F70A|nr:hypothetical protein [Gordonia amicalis]MDJ0454070.1 hypothetical protein [Gordonia amicalis]MDV7077214.1 hypothetical protein [Gordonia amicalis]
MSAPLVAHSECCDMISVNDLGVVTEQAVVTDARGDRMRATLVAAVENVADIPWDIARRGFDVTDIEEDERVGGECVCGQQGLRYLYTITHRVTGVSLYPIGSSCIGYFGVAAMTDRARDLRDLVELAAVARGGELLVLRGKGKHLTAAKLLALYDAGAFPATSWNRGRPADDYNFLLRMMRKRNEPSAAQKRKVDALLRDIEDFLRMREGGEE